MKNKMIKTNTNSFREFLISMVVAVGIIMATVIIIILFVLYTTIITPVITDVVCKSEKNIDTFDRFMIGIPTAKITCFFNNIVSNTTLIEMDLSGKSKIISGWILTIATIIYIVAFYKYIMLYIGIIYYYSNNPRIPWDDMYKRNIIFGKYLMDTLILILLSIITYTVIILLTTGDRPYQAIVIMSVPIIYYGIKSSSNYIIKLFKFNKNTEAGYKDIEVGYLNSQEIN